MDPANIRSFNDVVSFAIGKEEEAATLYRGLAERTDQSGVKQMFLDLATQEDGHKRRLQSIKRDGLPSGGDAPVRDLKISDFLSDVEVGPDSDYQEILIFAMKREEASVALYTNLASQAADAAISGVFEALADEERKHKLRLETEYDDNVLKWN